MRRPFASSPLGRATRTVGISASKLLIRLSCRLCSKPGASTPVTNAGVPFETTGMMRQRLDAEVPDGTDLVILQPGANDLRFFGSKEKRAENIAEMSERLRARSIPVIVYDEDIPIRYYTFDFIHLTREGHAMIATKLLPLVIAKLGLRQIPPRP